MFQPQFLHCEAFVTDAAGVKHVKHKEYCWAVGVPALCDQHLKMGITDGTQFFHDLIIIGGVIVAHPFPEFAKNDNPAYNGPPRCGFQGTQ